AIARAHKTSFRFRVLLQFLQCRSHGTGVNDDFVLRVSRFQFIQVTFQRLALAHAPRAAYRSELRAIDSNPLAAHQTYRACKPDHSAPASVTASLCTRRNSAMLLWSGHNRPSNHINSTLR